MSSGGFSGSENHSGKKILAVKTHAIGDVLMTTPAIRSIRQCNPDSEITFLTCEWSVPAVQNNPNIDKIICIPDDVFFKRRINQLNKWRQLLKKIHFDQTFVFQPSPFIHWFLFLSGVRNIAAPSVSSSFSIVRHRCGWRIDRNRYVVEDFLDVVQNARCGNRDSHLEYFLTDESVSQMKQRLLSVNPQNKPICVISPGGGTNPRDRVLQKIWPDVKFARLISNVQKAGLLVVVTGSEKEKPELKCARSVPGTIDWTGVTTFDELAALIRCSAFLVTNDSAPMHLALAVKKPFIAIFGPTRPTALLPHAGDFLYVHNKVKCSPCYDNMPFPGCDRMDCIESVSLEDVWSVVKQAIERWI